MYNTSKYYGYIFYADRNIRPWMILGYTLATFPKVAIYIYLCTTQEEIRTLAQLQEKGPCNTASYNNKQPQQSSTVGNQYKPAYNKPASMYNNSNSNAPLTSSSDIVGEVTLKTSVDGYQLLKVNEMIKNAVTWRARMPKTSKFSKYFDNKSKEGTPGMPEPKVHINEATLEVMGQAAKDFGYTEQEFVEAVEMYQYFGNQNLGDVPIPNMQD